jgi:hypothetical protein
VVPLNPAAIPVGKAVEFTINGELQGDISIVMPGVAAGGPTPDFLVLTDKETGLSSSVSLNSLLVKSEEPGTRNSLLTDNIKISIDALKRLGIATGKTVSAAYHRYVIGTFRPLDVGLHYNEYSEEAAWTNAAAGQRFAIVIHGINSNRDALETLADKIHKMTASPGSSDSYYKGVLTFEYDYRIGPNEPALQLLRELNKKNLISKNIKLDIYAHSFGGIVARYFAQKTLGGKS